MNKIIIESEKLKHNIDIIKKQSSANVKDENSKTPEIIAVLKDNAYGVSFPIMAKHLQENGISFFAVTDVYEALKLNECSTNAKILILNSTSIEEEVRIIVQNDFIASCGSYDSIDVLEKISKELSKNTRFHLNIDTGMSRFGFRADELLKTSSEEKLLIDELSEKIKGLENAKLDGIYTHFQQSYENDVTRTKEQFNDFINVINRLKEKEINVGTIHCCNTSAFFKYPYMHLDAVRVGSAFSGRTQLGNSTGLKRLGYLESQICEIRDLKAGDKVFYSGMFVAKNNMKVGVVEAGYTDGFELSGPKDNFTNKDKLRQIKNIMSSLSKDTNNYVLVNDKKCMVLGRIGMKNFVCDLTNVEDVKVGDKVKIDVKLSLCDTGIKREEI